MVVVSLHMRAAIVTAEVTADNTSIRVSWEWLCQSVLDRVRVHYRPVGRSERMHTVDTTTATSAILSNLQCNTEYTIWIYYVQSGTVHANVPRVVSLPARGMCLTFSCDFSLSLQ